MDGERHPAAVHYSAAMQAQDHDRAVTALHAINRRLGVAIACHTGHVEQHSRVEQMLLEARADTRRLAHALGVELERGGDDAAGV